MKKIVTWILFCIASNALASKAPSSAPNDGKEGEENKDLVSAYWEADAADKSTQEQLIIAANGDVSTLYAWLKQGPNYKKDVPRGILELYRTAKGGVRFPYVVVVPDTYNPQNPITVEFMLHGAVNRAHWGTGGKWWGKGKDYQKYLQRDQITVFPAAWREEVWWSDNQADNISSILRALKQTYNIDDNRAYLSGASDGGTGAYFFAFKQPSEWAAFLPYIGHMAVLTLKGEQQVGNMDIENLVNSAFFIVNGENDPLYPAKSVDPYIRILEQVKIDHVYTLIEKGGHDLKWLGDAQPAISVFKMQHVRNPLPEKLRWKTDRVDRYERIHWLKVDKLEYPNKPGWISALRKDNKFTVLTEDISRFTLLLNPDEVDLTRPILINLNGVTVFSGSAPQDAKVLFKWAQNRDKAQLFTAELTIDTNVIPKHD